MIALECAARFEPSARTGAKKKFHRVLTEARSALRWAAHLDGNVAVRKQGVRGAEAGT